MRRTPRLVTRSSGLDRTAPVATFIVLAVMVLALVLTSSAARADSAVSVTPTSSCTLAEAIDYADGSAEATCAGGTASGTTTINLGPGTYTLTGTLAVNADVNLVGSGASSTTISGNNAVQVVSVGSGVTAAISGVTITAGLSGAGLCAGGDGYISCGFGGGGISNAGSLNLDDVTVTGNATSGGDNGESPGGGCEDNPANGTYGCFDYPPLDAGDGGSGGGIENTGALTIRDSTVSDNVAGAGGAGAPGKGGTGGYAGPGQDGSAGGAGGNGGGIDNATGATLTLADSTLSDNQAGAGGAGGPGSQYTEDDTAGDAGDAGDAGVGGGIANFGTMTLLASTIANNRAGRGGDGGDGGGDTLPGYPGSSTPGAGGGDGGGIYSAAPSATSKSPGSPASTLTNVTVTGNTAPTGGNGGLPLGSGTGGQGGGIFHSGALLTLSFVTVAGNAAAGNAGGVENAGRSVSEADSIIAANLGPAPSNCSTGISDAGDDLVDGDTSCPGVNADPKLGALQDNGGPVQTMALGAGSAAIGLVPAANCAAATDARGVSRPQGSGCDAGAYEFAVPTIGGLSVTGSGQSTATVSASINPNASHADTSVTVAYGTSASYGATSLAQDIGRGDSPVAYSASLSGLQPATTYHYAITATNADGASTSSDGTFTTASPPASGTSPAASPPATGALSATVSSVRTSGSAVDVTIACSGGSAVSTCAGSLTLSSHVRTRATKVLAVTAEATEIKKPKPKPAVTKDETVASGTYSVVTGTSKVIAIKLNATGLELLATRYRLPATLRLSGTLTDQQTVALSYAVLNPKISAKWVVAGHVTTVTELVVTQLPSGAKVTVLCHGGGCPFTRRTFAPPHGAVRLSSAFAKVKLALGTRVEIEVTRAGAVGRVSAFLTRAGATPKLTGRCLLPGAKSPSVCVH